MLDLSTHLSDHFTVWELADHHFSPRRPPPDGELADNQQHLVTHVLEPIRVAWRRTLWVVSGYRTPASNVAVGGAECSQHMLARAADITPVPLAVADLLRRGLPAPPGAADLMREFAAFVQHWVLRDPGEHVGGWGLYPGWAHVDTRPRGPLGHIAHWVGRGIGSEQ